MDESAYRWDPKDWSSSTQDGDAEDIDHQEDSIDHGS